jgi:hypothetical protein
MRDERTSAHYEDRLDRTILVLLLDRERPWPCSTGELARELGHDPADGLARLHGAGLIWRRGEFVWPTRAAVRADELQL